jgi:hypothetical protein
MAPAPVVMVDVNDVEVTAGNHVGEINPELTQKGEE